MFKEAEMIFEEVTVVLEEVPYGLKGGSTGLLRSLRKFQRSRKRLKWSLKGP